MAAEVELPRWTLDTSNMVLEYCVELFWLTRLMTENTTCANCKFAAHTPKKLRVYGIAGDAIWCEQHHYTSFDRSTCAWFKSKRGDNGDQGPQSENA